VEEDGWMDGKRRKLNKEDRGDRMKKKVSLNGPDGFF
jgi:hypothetical protein